MIKKIFLLLFSCSLLVVLFPAISFANVGDTTIEEIAQNLTGVFWTIFAGAVVIGFIYSGIIFLTSAGDPQKLEKAKKAFLYSLAGTVVGILGYGITELIKSELFN